MKSAIYRMCKSTDSRRITAISRRITALFLIVVVLLFLIVSTWFIAHEADHECTGEDCPVCALLQMSESGLRQLGSGAPAAAAVSSLYLLILVKLVCTDRSFAIHTPVSRKTRLNN